MESIYAFLFLGLICAIGYFLHEKNSGRQPMVHNPLKPMHMLYALQQNKSLYGLILKQTSNIVNDASVPLQYQIEGGCNELQFMIYFTQQKNVLHISASVWHDYFEDFGPKITWSPINLTSNSYNYIGKHLAFQINETLKISISEMKEEYKLKIPDQN